MLCDICETIFSGGGELAPGGYDEYFHHRSARSFKTAIAAGCQLCTMLRNVLPECMLTTDWEYQSSVQEGSSQQTPFSETNQTHEVASEVSTSTYRSRKFYHRPWYLNRQVQDGRSELDSPTETTAFSLAYFRSDTQTGLPAVEFITMTSTGRAGIGGVFPLQILLFDQESCPSTQTDLFGSEDASHDYRCHSSSTSDRSAWSAARLWLTDCAQNHENSCSLNDPTFLPSRLVYLDSTNLSENEQVVRLCITAQLEQKDIKYMTLSHRWGDPTKIFQLTCDSIEKLTFGLPLNQLPPTFRNALEFALFCDIRYIWIDALCIKQDDREDWSEEAPLMGSIYHNAFCNLSAAGLSEPQNGLFVSRNQSESAPIMVSPRPDLWNSENRTIISPGSLYVCMPQDFFKRIVELAPVNDRAWVMQERVLSPRKIYFSEHQLFWECRRKKACEMFPNQIPEEAYEITPRSMGISYGKHEYFLLAVIDAVGRHQRLGLSTEFRDEAYRIRLLRAWRELLKQYVSCEITHASDRLIAITGVTKYLEQALGDECVYGLWRSELPFQLVFLYAGRTQPLEQDSIEGNPEIPSWSWAHYEGKLQLAPEIVDAEGDRFAWTEGWTKEALITVLDITFGEELPLLTEVGEILSSRRYPACLHLLCHLFPCMRVDDEDDEEDKADEEHEEHEEQEATGNTAGDNKRIEVMVFMGGMTTTTGIQFDSRIPENASIMPVFWYKQKMGWALVVSRIGGDDSTIFRRTGFMLATASFWKKLDKYLEICGDEQDTICLV